MTRKLSVSAAGGYTIIRKDRNRDQSGELASTVAQNVRYKTVDIPPPHIADSYLEVKGISVNNENTDTTLLNIYIPPINSIGTEYRPNNSHLL